MAPESFCHSADRLFNCNYLWTLNPATSCVEISFLLVPCTRKTKAMVELGPGPLCTVEEKAKGRGVLGREDYRSTQRTAGLGEGPHCQGWRSVPEEEGYTPPRTRPG